VFSEGFLSKGRNVVFILLNCVEMKKYIVFAFGLFVFLNSCRPDEEPIVTPDPYTGVAEAKINGEEFEFLPAMSPSPGNDSTFNLLLNYFIGNQVLRKRVFFRYIRQTLSVQPLFVATSTDKENLQCGFGTFLYDGDVSGNYYLLNPNDSIEDFFRFLSFDEASGEVSGVFQASFVVSENAIFDPNSPDTIVITDGYFETKISD